ncbi:MAG TPA: hypothetical protein VF334_14955 [Polyangia bacterium]
MRWKLLVAGGTLALSLLATVIVACSSAPSCHPNTLLLQIALVQTAPLADTITVTETDPNTSVMQSFPHPPNSMNPGIEHTVVEISFPNGYPADKLVHFLVRAISGATVLGANSVTVHTDPTCTVADVAVTGGSTGPTDGGMTD